MQSISKNDLKPSDWYVSEYDNQLRYDRERVKGLINFGSIFFKHQVMYDSHLMANESVKSILYEEPRFLKDGILVPVLRKEIQSKTVKSFYDVYEEWKRIGMRGMIHDDAYPEFLDRVVNVAVRGDNISSQYWEILNNGLEFEKRINAMGLSQIVNSFKKTIMQVKDEEHDFPWRNDVYAAIERFPTHQEKLKLVADYAYAENMANYLDIGYQYAPVIREAIFKWNLRQNFEFIIEQFLRDKNIVFQQEINPNPFDIDTLTKLDYFTIEEIRKSYAAKSFWQGWEEAVDVTEFQARLQAYIDTCRELIFEQVTGIKAEKTRLYFLKTAGEGSVHIALILKHLPSDLASITTEVAIPLLLIGIEKLLEKREEKTKFENMKKGRKSLLEKA